MKPVFYRAWFVACVIHTASTFIAHSFLILQTTAEPKQVGKTLHDSSSVPVESEITESSHTAAVTTMNVVVTPNPHPVSSQEDVTTTTRSLQTLTESVKVLIPLAHSLPLIDERMAKVSDPWAMTKFPKTAMTTLFDAGVLTQKKRDITFSADSIATSAMQETRAVPDSDPHQIATERMKNAPRYTDVFPGHETDLSAIPDNNMKTTDTVQRKQESMAAGSSQTTTPHTDHALLAPVKQDGEKDMAATLGTVVTSKVTTTKAGLTHTDYANPVILSHSPPDQVHASTTAHLDEGRGKRDVAVSVTPLLTTIAVAKTNGSTNAAQGNLSTLPGSPAVQCNKSCCNCLGTKAICWGDARCKRQLPQLPARIRNFIITNAVLISLTRQGMAALKNVHIHVLNLKYNGISRLAPDTFMDFRNLTVLHLKGNVIPVTILSAALRSISSPNLEKLYLDNMGLTYLPDDFFGMFESKSFEFVGLRSNHLRSFNSSAFTPFSKVEYLDLSRNAISRVNISCRLNVKRLLLKENKLEEFPDLCLHLSNDTEVVPAFYKLESLRLGHNDIATIPPHRVRGACLPHLKKLDISFWMKLRVLENNFIADLPLIERLVANRLEQLGTYQPFAFNSSSLKLLSLRRNAKIQLKTAEAENMFKHCPNLQKLSIHNTKLVLKERDMWLMLSPLTSLTDLHLEHVRLGSLPQDLLWRFPRLKKLVVNSNRISSASLGAALRNVTSLRHLAARDNNIQVVNASTLPWSVRRNLTYLDLSSNPYACTCQLRWFQSWLVDISRNKSIIVHGYTYKDLYTCDTPSSRRRLQLQEFHLTEQDCSERSLALGLGLAGACVLTLVFVTFGLVYRFRWYLRLFLYRCRRRRQQAGEERGYQLYELDMYVACSSGELTWVLEHLVPLLEEVHGLKTFVLDRDTTPGTVLADNIPSFMDRCARILLLISDDYMREQWRLYEFQHIVYASVDQQKDVIVVLLGDVEAGRMTKEMTRMLTRGTFLQWDEDEEAQGFFREGLRVALKTEDPACQNVCLGV